jgi:hypothetical protein
MIVDDDPVVVDESIKFSFNNVNNEVVLVNNTSTLSTDTWPIKPPWFGDDPCRGRFIGLPAVMCELCPCPCCKWGGEFHTLSTLRGLSS